MYSSFDDIPQPPGWPPARFERFVAALARAIVHRQHRGRRPRPAFDVGARRHLAWTAVDFLLARDALAAGLLAEREGLIDAVAEALAARLSRRDDEDGTDACPPLPELASVVTLFGPARFDLVGTSLRAPLPGAQVRPRSGPNDRGGGSVEPRVGAASRRSRRSTTAVPRLRSAATGSPAAARPRTRGGAGDR